tara:strand:- start:165 stop:350 length:186 start_codon:yes stop_codon:yes gene_type:complete
MIGILFLSQEFKDISNLKILQMRVEYDPSVLYWSICASFGAVSILIVLFCFLLKDFFMNEL